MIVPIVFMPLSLIANLIKDLNRETFPNPKRKVKNK